MAHIQTQKQPRIFWALIYAFALVGCGNHLPESIGPAQEILVLVDPADQLFLETPLQNVFEKVIYTPQEEKIFNLKFGNVTDFERYKYKRRKNILVVAPIDSAHATSSFLRNLLSPEVQDAVRHGNTAAVWKEDIWAQEQLLITISGNDITALTDNIYMEADRLYSALEEARNRRIGKLIYHYGEREDLTRQLADDYGWSVRVPFGYRILEAHPDSGFVVLSKDEPNRWFFVYWEDGIPPDQLSELWCIQKRNQITRRFFDHDRIVPEQTEVHQTEFSGKLAFVLQGLWENEKSWAGGPFKSYAFVDIERNRFFYIDFGIYSPNKLKEPYLRQIDLMAQSFKLAEEKR